MARHSGSASRPAAHIPGPYAAPERTRIIRSAHAQGLLHPVPKAGLRDPEILRKLGYRLLSKPSQFDRPLAELRRVWTWHLDLLSETTNGLARFWLVFAAVGLVVAWSFVLGGLSQRNTGAVVAGAPSALAAVVIALVVRGVLNRNYVVVDPATRPIRVDCWKRDRGAVR